MADHPTDWLHFLLRFLCAALVLGISIALILLQFELSSGHWWTIWGTSTGVLSLLSALYGREWFTAIWSAIFWWP